MHQIQLLLPVYDNEKKPFPHSAFDRVFNELMEDFGGVTAYQRAPAQGAWRAGGEVSHDEVVTFDVMVARLDRSWWALYRDELEQRFRQDSLVIRATEIELL
jgi:hypothetical protein